MDLPLIECQGSHREGFNSPRMTLMRPIDTDFH